MKPDENNGRERCRECGKTIKVGNGRYREAEGPRCPECHNGKTQEKGPPPNEERKDAK